MRVGKLMARNAVVHIVVGRTRMVGVTERAVGVVMMPVVTMIPVAMHRPAMPAVPPVGIIAPVPRRVPAAPRGSPEPVVDVRTIDIYRLDYIVRTVNILVTNHLCADLPGRLILLDVDGSNILENILRQHGLDNNEVLVAVVRFHTTQVINRTVAVEVKIGESGIGVVKERFELLDSLNCTEQCSHRLQIERLAYVL